jgi:peptidyl-prolyl cis-trans isomerase D
MLDRMRRRRNWLKWSLGIVVAAFIALYFPSFMGTPGGGTAPGDSVATVDGRPVLMGTFQRAYDVQVQQLRNAYGDQFNEQMLQQLQMPMRVLQQLVDEETVQAEADYLGIRVSDEELRERILSIPAFQMNGQFMGWERYQQFLRGQRPPMTPGDFENQIRRQIKAEKLQALITGWIQVDDAEVEREYRRRNEKVKLQLAIFTAGQFRGTIQPSDAELKAHFDADPEKYRLPEKRRVRYLAVDANTLKDRMTVTTQELQARYQQNASMYSTPEQVRASHILLKTEGKDKAEVRKQAEQVLAKVKAGGDFAALAKQYSEDTSKDQGGDLDYFGRGRMVKPFEDAAWALEVGQTSGIVESEFGFHIIKLTDKKAATTRTLDEVRPQLEEQIKMEKARAEAAAKADQLASRIDEPADLDAVARDESLAVSDSGLFARDEPLAGLGFAPAVASRAFEMEVGKVSEKLVTPQGFAWIALTEIKPSAVPTLEEARDKVRDDLVRVKSVEVARTRAATMAQQAARGNFAAAAKAAGVEVKTTELITRGSALPEIGINQAVEDVVFGLKAGDTSGPIATDNAVVVARVTERQDVKPEDIQTNKDSVRDELRQRRQGEFFASYMTKAREKMPPEYNENALKVIMSSR